jgi:hypothetical protein
MADYLRIVRVRLIDARGQRLGADARIELDEIRAEREFLAHPFAHRLGRQA